MRYPHNLEFVHSHGLGVLQINDSPNQNKEIKLSWLKSSFLEKQQLINYFAALGSRQIERYAKDDQISNLECVVHERDLQIKSFGSIIEQKDCHISNLDSIIEQYVAEKNQLTDFICFAIKAD